MREVLLCAPFLLIPFAIQLVILFATRRRFGFLRFAVPILSGAAVVIVPLLACLTAPPGWGVLLAPLVIIICLLLASLALMGWFLAGSVYYLIKLTSRSRDGIMGLDRGRHPSQKTASKTRLIRTGG